MAIAQLSARLYHWGMTTEFGTRLKLARKRIGLTQTELGHAIGAPQSTISTAEKTGHTSMHTAQLARALGVSAHWLATGEGEMLSPDAVGEVGTPQQAAPAKPAMRHGGQQLQQLYDALFWFAEHIPDEKKKRAALASCVHVMNRFFLESQGVRGMDAVPLDGGHQATAAPSHGHELAR